MIGSAGFINAGEEPHPSNFIGSANVGFQLASRARFFSASADMINKSWHIFGPNLARHRLGAFLEVFGGDRILATQAILNAVRAAAAARFLTGSQTYREVVVLYGFRIEVIFRIVDGVVRLSSAGLERN